MFRLTEISYEVEPAGRLVAAQFQVTSSKTTRSFAQRRKGAKRSSPRASGIQHLCGLPLRLCAKLFLSSSHKPRITPHPVQPDPRLKSRLSLRTVIYYLPQKKVGHRVGKQEPLGRISTLGEQRLTANFCRDARRVSNGATTGSHPASERLHYPPSGPAGTHPFHPFNFQIAAFLSSSRARSFR